MNCDVCELEEVTFIVGNAQTGDQQMLGPACFARMALEIAKAILPAEEIASTLGPLFVKPAETPSPEAQKAPGGRKRKAATEEPPAPPRPSEGPPAEHAAGTDG